MLAPPARPPAVVFLAAGAGQVAHLEAVAAMPLGVIAVDRNPEAPGFRHAHERIVASTHDAGPLLDRLRALRQRYTILGVLSGSHGPATVTAAEVAAGLGLRTTPAAMVRVINDKGRFPAACRDLGLHVPRQLTAASASAVDWAPLPYPLVLRPAATLVGKAGVILVRDPSEALERFGHVQACSASGLVEVSAYVEGHDVIAIGFVTDGALTPLALLDELNTFAATGALVGGGVSVPSRYAGTPAERAVHEAAAAVARGLALERTPFMLSLRVDAQGVAWIIELHLQLGGDFIFEGLLAASASLDLTRLVVGGALGLLDTPPALTFRPLRTARDAAGRWVVTSTETAL